MALVVPFRSSRYGLGITEHFRDGDARLVCKLTCIVVGYHSQGNQAYSATCCGPKKADEFLFVFFVVFSQPRASLLNRSLRDR